MVHSVSQRPNLGHLYEPLGGTKGLIETTDFKKMTQTNNKTNDKQH